MSMWEPFTERARHAIVRAQEVAQMFGSPGIGTQHILFGLADSDDELGALLSRSIDRSALKERLGAAGQAPTTEMVFSGESKHAIERAFVHARAHNDRFIDTTHISLGILDAEMPDLVPGVGRDALEEAIATIARTVREADGPPAAATHGGAWRLTNGGDGDAAFAEALLRTLGGQSQLPAGTQVQVSVIRPDDHPRSYTFERREETP